MHRQPFTDSTNSELKSSRSQLLTALAANKKHGWLEGMEEQLKHNLILLETEMKGRGMFIGNIKREKLKL